VFQALSVGLAQRFELQKTLFCPLLCSCSYAFVCAGHTFGHFATPDRGPVQQKLFADSELAAHVRLCICAHVPLFAYPTPTVQSFHFDVMGQQSTFWLAFRGMSGRLALGGVRS
jgi:hypothetical protein